MTTTNPAPAAPDHEARARISALIDGELVGDEHDRAIDALLASDELARFWHDCHRAGDCLRSDEVGGAEPCAEFMAKLSARLATEPAIVAPHAIGPATTVSRSFWLRAGLPSASVAAAIAVVAWVAIPTGRPDASAPSVASSAPLVQAVGNDRAALQPAVTEVGARAPMDADQVSDYLAAHGDVSPFAYRGAGPRQASYVKPVAEVGR